MITKLDIRDINLQKIELIDKLLSSMNEDLELIRSDNMKPELHLCYFSCKLKKHKIKRNHFGQTFNSYL